MTTPGVIEQTAAFDITNILPSGYVLEGRKLKFHVEANYADFYHWDFGNGITSDSRTPKNISYAPCDFLRKSSNNCQVWHAWRI